jgi:glycerol-3-phosphate acyltransferase PlsX
VAANLVKNGEAEAMISAGNTGAAMATAFFVLGKLKGVERPAIATLMPAVNGFSILLDVGANVDCKPSHLLQFAVMGSVYAKRAHGLESPTVGLLSIGEEDSKGNELTRETFKLLKASDLNFIGNVEGRDVFNGRVNIVVCDGFIGNVALKISEGLAEAMGTLLKKEIGDMISGQVGYLLLRPAFKRFKKRIDYSEYGGAPLLGINGICIISHGRSSAKAIKNAVRAAYNLHSSQVNKHIREDIESNVKKVEKARPASSGGKEGVLK